MVSRVELADGQSKLLPTIEISIVDASHEVIV
jgi:hypothetical protein